VARNATRDALRYRWSQKRDVRRETALPGELAEPSVPPDLHVETPEERALAREAPREHLRRRRACLPVSTCRALVLVYLVGFTCAEAAGLLGVSAAARQSRLYRAWQRPRERPPRFRRSRGSPVFSAISRLTCAPGTPYWWKL